MAVHLQFLATLTVLALPVMAQASPPSQSASFIANATTARASSRFIEVANRHHPHRAVNRHNDRGNDTGDAQVEQLNQMSLQRAQQGQNSPGTTPDTTSNLNTMSGQDAARGQNTGSKPLMPFR